MNLRDARLHAFGDVTAVLSREHHRGSDDGFVAVEGRGAGAEARSGFDVGHIPDQDRLHARAEFQGQGGDFLRVADPAHRANGELLAASADDAPARILDVLGDQVRQFAESHTHGFERAGLGLNHELPLVAAAAVDLRDAADAAQQGPDGVLLNLTQLDELLQFGGGLVRGAREVADAVIKNLSKAGADGRELRRSSRGQSLKHALQPFRSELTRAVDVRILAEVQGHLRETELRQGPHFLHPRQTRHLAFDDLGDELLRFLGGECRDFGVDLNLNAGDVRHGVNGQVERRPRSGREQRNRPQKHHRALAQ